jgi:dihydrofolate synthase/folylpolyglutamate synthase
MTYQQSLDFIYSFQNFSKKPGLHRMEKALKELGNPQEKLACIHIAGTNGKGSTAAMLASVLKEAGYKVGLYTSPYIYDFRERIQIEGALIGKELLVELVERIKPLALKSREEGDPIGVFEYITLMGFLAFHKKGCEIVVLETGIGGRLDATNVITKPLMSLLTMIDLDHVEILGDTLSKIAKEKCGIIKESGITITYPYQKQEALSVIEEEAIKKQNRLIVPSKKDLQNIEVGLKGTRFNYKSKVYTTALLGTYQAANTVVVIEAIESLINLGYQIQPNHITKGLLATKWPGRLEVVSQNPYILVDGAHNEAGIDSLVDFIKLLPLKHITIFFSMMADKNYHKALASLATCARSIVLLEPAEPRAATIQMLLPIAKDLFEEVEIAKNIEEALEIKRLNLKQQEGIVLCGSLHRIGEMKEALCKFKKGETQ